MAPNSPRIGLLLLVLLAACLAGCRPSTPSVLDPAVDEAWLLKQKHRLDPFRTASPALLDRSLVAFSANATSMAWLESTAEGVELWWAPRDDPRRARRLHTRPHPQGYFHLNLSPGGQACLLLRQDPSIRDRRQQAVLERWDIEQGQAEEITRTASSYFQPSWLDSSDHAFVFAETSADFMRVLEQRPDGSRFQALAHEADYPRLVISPFAPDSYIIYDRNRPKDTHCWIREKSGKPGGALWREFRLADHQVRLLGTYQDRVVALSRDGDQTSRLMALSPEALDRRTGRLRLEGDTLLSLSVADYGLVTGHNVALLERQGWGHHLRTFELETRQTRTLTLPCDIGLGHKLFEVTPGRAAFLYEGPLQPVSVALLDLDSGRLNTLREYSAEGLGKVEITSQGDPIQLRAKNSDPQAPTLLEAYGAFRQEVLPRWDGVRAEWLRRGGQVVIAQVQGMPRRQAESRDELLARADALKDRPLVLRGQSAGGTLALMAFLEKPDLFRAVWADAAVTDLLAFPSLKPGELWVDEFGDPTTPEERARLEQVSPLHQVDRRSYPTLLLSSSETDPAVNLRHSTRFLQRVEEFSPESPTFFLLQSQGIHDKLPGRPDELSVAVELLWQAATRGEVSP